MANIVKEELRMIVVLISIMNGSFYFFIDIAFQADRKAKHNIV